MKYGGIIIEKSLETGYRLIIRPHPRPFTSDKEQNGCVGTEAWVNIGNSAESIADYLVKIDRAF